ncbi:hypothetical protein PoB_004777700 [Plakobranchus ocellatus]|uniref:Uncharacterized protein n=1 Tax=Plakobranchus ocellatus TaxID=259542 RepID=A0AAV4BQM3_9GAST|nr:hypothetical protein PoB_004777700 [Plakobranchus ocellatus]
MLNVLHVTSDSGFRIFWLGQTNAECSTCDVRLLHLLARTDQCWKFYMWHQTQAIASSVWDRPMLNVLHVTSDSGFRIFWLGQTNAECSTCDIRLRHLHLLAGADQC